MENIFEGAEIYSYTRDEAIADGVLMNVSKQAQEHHGFRYQVIITDHIFNALVSSPEQTNNEANLDFLLASVKKAIQDPNNKDDHGLLEFYYNGNKLWAICESYEPVLTIMFPEDY